MSQSNNYKLNISASGNVGFKREHNEDMLLIGNYFFRDKTEELEIQTSGKFILALADGMGGHNAGEIASEIVLNKLGQFIEELETNLAENELENRLKLWLDNVHNSFLEHDSENLAENGMGTTLVALLFYQQNIFLINAGDSRAYRYRNEILRQLSKDHTLAVAMRNNDMPSNVITNSIGGGAKTAFLDFENITSKISSEDTLLLCSDGLTDMASDDEIENALTINPSAENLIHLANNNGGKDNVSVILAKLELE